MTSSRDEDDVDADVSAAIEGDRPIIVGPWIAEVGFEALYWIPFLRSVFAEHAVERSRVVVVSRGGVESWYDGLCARYLDILDLLSADEFRRMTAARFDEVGGQKQTRLGWWDTGILDRVREVTGLSETGLLHPSLMYRRFRAFWVGRASVSHVTSQLRFAPFAVPRSALLERQLPSEEFIAARFYERSSFPATPNNRQFVAALLHELGAERPVVLLDTGIELDDHTEFDATTQHRVHRPLVGLSAGENLRAQSVIISRSSAFIGTYGGLVYVASALGVPAFGFWSKPHALVPAHLEVGRIAADFLGAPASGLDTEDFRLVSRLATPAHRHGRP